MDSTPDFLPSNAELRHYSSSPALDYKEVEKETAERHDWLRGDAASDEPPPIHD